MNTWFSSKELINLPGLPNSVRNINLKAKKQGWKSRERKGRGGGKEYHFSSLPQETQVFLLQRQNENTVTTNDTQENVISVVSEINVGENTIYSSEDSEQLHDGDISFVVQNLSQDLPVVNSEITEKEIEEATKLIPIRIIPGEPKTRKAISEDSEKRIVAKDFLLRQLDRFIAICDENGYGWNAMQKYEQFAKLYNLRSLREFELEIPNEIYEIVPKISRSQLYSDRQKRNKQGSRALGGGGYGNRKGTGLIDSNEALQQAIKACLAAYHCQLDIKLIPKLLETQFGFVPPPSYHQVLRWVKKFEKEEPFIYLSLKDTNAVRNKLAKAFGKQGTDIFRPNQLWELDSSPTDLNLRFVDETTGEVKKKRYTLIGAIDVYTRRVKLVVAETSNSKGILLLMRKTILDWGVPEGVKTDNGSDYISNRVQSFLGDLDIAINLCTPGQPQEKPHIERFFRTFQHSEMSLLPGFVGHNVTQRAELRSHDDFNERVVDLELDASEFQAWADQWCKAYESRKHSGIDDKRPIEMLTTAAAHGWLKRAVATERQLDFLLMEGKAATVGKSGVMVNKRLYVAVELEVGSPIHVRFDPQDPSRIYCYDSAQLNEFICEAVWRDDPNIDLAEIASRKSEVDVAVREAVAASKRAGRKLKKQLADDPYSVLNSANVEPLQRTVEFTNQAIETVARAADPTPRNYEPTPQEQEAHDKQILRLEVLEGKASQEDPGDRFHRLLIERQSGVLSEDDQRFFDRFSKTPQGQMILRLMEAS